MRIRSRLRWIIYAAYFPTETFIDTFVGDSNLFNFNGEPFRRLSQVSSHKRQDIGDVPAEEVT